MLDEANALIARAAPFDMRAELADVRAWRAALDGVWRLPTPPARAAGPAPIFVVGMPRSGTTLIERVLARAPDVVAGGETGLLAPEAMRHLPPTRTAAAHGARALGAVGDGYRGALARRFGAAGG